MATATNDPFAAAISTIKERIPQNLSSPTVGIVCGSGLKGLADSLTQRHEISYDDLKGFGKSTVKGHESVLAFGMIGQMSAVVMLGRLHPYEGHPVSTVIFPIRVFALLGVKNMIITNASGALNPNIGVGTIVVVQDHLAIPNLTGHLNPLLGPSLPPPFQARFVPLSTAYSRHLRKLAFRAAYDLTFQSSALAEGTYAWVSGPTYETPAEGRFLRSGGADVVGMSTVPEVVAARQAGMEVLVLSLVTNMVIIPETYYSARAEVEAELAGKILPPVVEAEVSHEEVLEIGRIKAEDMKKLVQRIIELI